MPHESARAGRPLEVGDVMPDFALPDADGNLVSRGGLLGRGPVVVFFYPRDETIGCTVEACAFRDAFDELSDAGVTVVGISADNGESHRRFRARHALPYPLLTDRDGVVARRFGVRALWGLLPGRETFVVDDSGVIRAHLRSLSQPKRHVELALHVVQQLSSQSATRA
jgi:peroxiredoxin Q/BCP